MFRTLTVEEDGGVATVTLNRPEVRNAFDADMIAELTTVFAGFRASGSIRAVVLAGRGKVFSAGADVSWMRAAVNYSVEDNVADAERMSDMFAAIERLPVPVIARVHGAALGGGMGLIAVCDIVVAEESAVFGFTEVKLGIIPAVISPYIAPKVGLSWMRALFLSGERFDATLARSLGLVHWVVPVADLDVTVRAKVNEVLTGGPVAVAAAKQLIFDLQASPPSDHRQLTARRIAEIRTGSEGQSGLRAFLDRLPPPWHSEITE